MASTAHTPPATTAGPREISAGRTRSTLWRAGPSALAGATACALLIALAWRQGGYFPEDHLPAGAIAFGVLAALLLVKAPGFGISGPALLGLTLLSGFALWTGLSSHWSSAPDTALDNFMLAIVHVGVLGLGIMAAGSGRYSRHLLWGVLGTLAVVVCAGLISRLYPDTLDPFDTFSRFAGYRLAYPVGYWNAFGAMGAMGLVLAAGLASDPRSPMVLRSLAAGLAIPIGTAAYLSFSRGAWLAFFAGLAVLVLVSSHRIPLLATLALCGAGLAASLGRLAGLDGLTEGPRAGGGVRADGASFGPFVLALAVLVAFGQAFLSGRWMAAHTRAQLTRAGRRAGVVVAGLLVVAAICGYALRTEKIEGVSAARVISAEGWLDREWDVFMTPAPVGTTGTERLTTARGSRSDLYRIAIDGFEAHPLWGDGSGGYEYRFAYDHEIREKVRDAHSLYLEALGELGLPGFLLVLGFVGSVAWAATVARRRQDALSGAQCAAAAAAFTVWAVHAGVDWDWEMPALTGPALLLAAALYPLGRRGTRRGRRRTDSTSGV